MDFNGRDNRYGQIAVPDFIEYLCSRVTQLAQLVSVSLITQLQCSRCKWISESSSNDLSIKLYIPSDVKRIHLGNLFNYNSVETLSRTEAVYCGKCNLKTSHTKSRTYGNPDMVFIEIIRVSEHNNYWTKNNASIDFNVTKLKLPRFQRLYNVLATCHHRGSLNGGHWLTKFRTTHGWWELDDLRNKNYTCYPPGSRDDSVTYLLLIADNTLKMN